MGGAKIRRRRAAKRQSAQRPLVAAGVGARGFHDPTPHLQCRGSPNRQRPVVIVASPDFFWDNQRVSAPAIHPYPPSPRPLGVAAAASGTVL